MKTKKQRQELDALEQYYEDKILKLKEKHVQDLKNNEDFYTNIVEQYKLFGEALSKHITETAGKTQTYLNMSELLKSIIEYEKANPERNWG